MKPVCNLCGNETFRQQLGYRFICTKCGYELTVGEIKTKTGFPVSLVVCVAVLIVSLIIIGITQ